MISRLSFAVAFTAMTATSVMGQSGSFPIAADDPASQLSANLVILSQNPRDVNALIEAGQSAVAVGDGNAALGFLARAEEIAPRNGRIKAALGSALLLLERPGEALKLFSEASALGIPDSDIAADRGLAHDLRGESRKAQRDYLLAQRIAPSDELIRRLALSYGISGDRSNALSMLDPLLRKQDQAAWRARAFILAMTGDLSEAEDIASTVMPAGMGNGMRPFLRRLAALNPADRAMAVNFGTMPGDGTRLASNDYAQSSSSAVGGLLIPAGDILAPRIDDRPVRTAAVSITRDPRRRPGAADPAGGRPVVAPEQSGSAVPTAPPPAAIRPAPALATPGRSERRIEKRLAPVDQDRLPPEIRAALAPPPPTSRTPEPVGGSVIVAARPAPKVEAVPIPPSAPAIVTAAPVFEVPSAITPPITQIAGAGVVPAQAGDSQPNKVEFASVAPGKPLVAPQPVLAPVVSVPAPLPDAGFSVSINQPSRALASAPSTMMQPSGSTLIPEAAATALDAAQLASVTETAAVDQGAAAVASFARPVAPSAPVPTTPQGVVPSPEPTRLADIIATIEPEAETAAAPLPTAAELRAARIAQQKKLAMQAKAEADAKAEKDAKDAARKEAAKHPARVWVQVATGANEAGLPTTWKRIREKSPQLFKGLSAASVPFKSTNRLLIGPIKSQTEARALVNALQKAGLAGTTYASEAGQEIARIASK